MLALLTGCLSQSVPQSKIKAGGAEFALPKNSKVGHLTITIANTNGTSVQFDATDCTWENDANVLNAVTAHDIGVANAISGGISSVLQSGIKSGIIPMPK